MEPSSPSNSTSLEHIFPFLTLDDGVATKNPTKTGPLSRFGELPAEVRCLIWLFLPDPRLVPLRCEHSIRRYSARVPIPVILQINRESRYEGLRVYHQIRLGPNENIGCYVDPLRDTVYLTSNFKRPRILPSPMVLRQSRNEYIRDLIQDLYKDICSSPDLEALFKDLTVGARTWKLLFHHLCNRRFGQFLDLRSVRPVYEKGNGPVHESIQLQEFKPLAAGEDDPIVRWKGCPFPQSSRYSVGYQSLIHDDDRVWEHIMDIENGKDMLTGRPAILQFQISQCYIDKGGNEGNVYRPM
ncbi:uncharacterized protein PAC_07736 [Phialocephala subalpina]|uniref:2EXR domain-containing protein n=1 Tax=Phialocephala subalpina TaxID=576137 RepID=A0A1L7WYJ9_9HELO|nr:uncharacterized protein PAC_07736 [Phialocephala subalpina]